MADTLTLQEDSVGLQLLISFIDGNGSPVSVAGASGVFVILKDPSNTVVTRTASVVGDGTAGQISYTTTSSDITTPGTWQYQGKVTYSGSVVFFSEVKRIKIKANL